jgi:uncharacterized Zn finger protein
MTVLRCPNCGETRASGGRFLHMRMLSGVTIRTVEDETPEGLSLRDANFEVTGRRGPDLLSCGDCGHTWPTTRVIAETRSPS